MWDQLVFVYELKSVTQFPNFSLRLSDNKFMQFTGTKRKRVTYLSTIFSKKKDSDELVFFNRTITLLFRLLLR